MKLTKAEHIARGGACMPLGLNKTNRAIHKDKTDRKTDKYSLS